MLLLAGLELRARDVTPQDLYLLSAQASTYASQVRQGRAVERLPSCLEDGLAQHEECDGEEHHQRENNLKARVRSDGIRFLLLARTALFGAVAQPSRQPVPQ